LVYDVLRYAWPSDWCPPVNDPGTCLAPDQSETTATDPALPDPGDVLFYLIRADNACERRSGPLGVDSAGRIRFGIDCP